MGLDSLEHNNLVRPCMWLTMGQLTNNGGVMTHIQITDAGMR